MSVLISYYDLSTMVWVITLGAALILVGVAFVVSDKSEGNAFAPAAFGIGVVALTVCPWLAFTNAQADNERDIVAIERTYEVRLSSDDHKSLTLSAEEVGVLVTFPGNETRDGKILIKDKSEARLYVEETDGTLIPAEEF